MNLVTTQHSSNKFGSAFAAPRFSYLLFILAILAILQSWSQRGIPESGAKLCNSFCNSVANMQSAFCHLIKIH